MKKHIVLLVATALVYLPGLAAAQRQIELIPSISVSETYDDNIFLSQRNERSDYITAVTPSLTLNTLSEYTKLGLNYRPTFVWYADFSENNTTRHQGTVSWEQRMTQYLSFNLTNTYLRSEDPLDDPEDFDAERTTRNKYWTNTGRASLGFVFGEENTLDVGYTRIDRENDDLTLNDRKVHAPFLSITYWFDVKNGIRVDYNYRDVTLSRDDDYMRHNPGVSFRRRFSPDSIGYIGYLYDTYDFDGRTEDYVVHTGFVGLDHAFSPEYSISARVGYFVQVNEVSENNYGPTFRLATTRTFARGSIEIGGDGGFDSGTERRGRGTDSREYYGLSVRGSYRILERVSIFGRAFYRWSRYEIDQVKESNFRGDFGVRWSFMRYASLSLEYRYADRTSDIEVDTYTNNRVMLMLNVTKPYQWFF
jgi:hypothetical protein